VFSVQTKIISLEGNIGAGKTTLLNEIKKRINVATIDEPVGSWQGDSGKDGILKLFYQDPDRWAYTFQSYAFMSRAKEILGAIRRVSGCGPLILERSIYSDKFCFAKNCFESGKMNEVEWDLYKTLFSLFEELGIGKINGIIYLKSSPEICFERIRKRGRSEEKGIDFEYVKKISENHEEWVLENNAVGIPILTLSCEKDFENDEIALVELLQKVESFIKRNVLGIEGKTSKKGLGLQV
jgi:deoxyadenosine/deoxycytidine kinase